jgi:hypothetical protein
MQVLRQLQQAVLLQFLAQGIAIDAENSAACD